MTDAPSLRQQIEAVEWAMRHVAETGKRAHEREGVIDHLRRALIGAAETLKTLEFTREVAR
jgi:hypothetical protein